MLHQSVYDMIPDKGYLDKYTWVNRRELLNTPLKFLFTPQITPHFSFFSLPLSSLKYPSHPLTFQRRRRRALPTPASVLMMATTTAKSIFYFLFCLFLLGSGLCGQTGPNTVKRQNKKWILLEWILLSLVSPPKWEELLLFIQTVGERGNFNQGYLLEFEKF